MRALLIYADGRTEVCDTAAADVMRIGSRWFHFVGVAVDRNTTVDGVQLEGADGPPNDGRAVYLEKRSA